MAGPRLKLRVEDARNEGRVSNDVRTHNPAQAQSVSSLVTPSTTSAPSKSKSLRNPVFLNKVQTISGFKGAFKGLDIGPTVSVT
jgi:hypothetical protein